MSYRHINAARDVEGLDLTAKLLLLTIATYTDDRGRAWCSTTTLAHDVGVHPKSVSRALKRVTKVVPLMITRRHGQSSIYDFHSLNPPRSWVTGTPRAAGLPTPRAAGLPNPPSEEFPTPLRRAEAAASEGRPQVVPPATTRSGLWSDEEPPDIQRAIDLCIYCDEHGYLERDGRVGRCSHRPTRRTTDLIVPPEWST